MSIYAKEFLAIFFAFKEFGHIFWGTPKPVIILTDNKSVTRFFQTKIIPPTLWNACDYVMQFSFTIAHIPGKNNTAADYLSRLEISPKKNSYSGYGKTFPPRPLNSTSNRRESLKRSKSSIQTMTKKQKNKSGSANKTPGPIQRINLLIFCWTTLAFTIIHKFKRKLYKN